MLLARLAPLVLALPFIAFFACGGGGSGASGEGPKTAEAQAKPEDGPSIAETRDRVTKVANAATLWRSRHPNACPGSIDELKAGRALDPFAQPNDAWGNPLQIK